MKKKIDKFTLTAIAVPTNLKTTPSYAWQTEPLLVPGSNFYTKRCWENFLKIFWKSIRQKMLIVVWKHKFCGVKLGQIIFSWGKIESIKQCWVDQLLLLLVWWAMWPLVIFKLWSTKLYKKKLQTGRLIKHELTFFFNINRGPKRLFIYFYSVLSLKLIKMF